MKTLLEVLHIYILCTIYIGLYRLSGSLLLLMRQFRVSYSRHSTGLPKGVALFSRGLSPGAPSVTELQFRILVCYAHLHFRYCLIWHNDLWPMTCARSRVHISFPNEADLAHTTCYSVPTVMCTKGVSMGFLQYRIEPKLHNTRFHILPSLIKFHKSIQYSKTLQTRT